MSKFKETMMIGYKMNMLSKGMGAAAIALGCALAMGGNAHARDQVNIDLLTTGFGTGSYVMGTALEEVSKKNHDWLRINATETPGFPFNLRKIDEDEAAKKMTIIGTGPGTIGLARGGQKPFKKKHKNTPKLIANYSIGTYWLASISPGVKKIEDLNGKKVALGRAAQTSWAVQPAAVVEQGYNMKGKVDIQYVGVESAIAALLDGNVDAAIVGGYWDPMKHTMTLSPQTTEFMASGRNINFLSMGDAEIKRAVEAGVTMLSLSVPKGAIAGIDYDLNVVADTVSWAASPEFPEELAYEITKLIINNLDSFGKFHALGKLMSPDGLVYGWDIEDIHPGAVKAYKEAGILK
ncbi:MAG: TAXI family TRAP transporter solute-binding subunit [Castellaniella sp.]